MESNQSRYLAPTLPSESTSNGQPQRQGIPVARRKPHFSIAAPLEASNGTQDSGSNRTEVSSRFGVPEPGEDAVDGNGAGGVIVRAHVASGRGRGMNTANIMTKGDDFGRLFQQRQRRPAHHTTIRIQNDPDQDPQDYSISHTRTRMRLNSALCIHDGYGSTDGEAIIGRPKSAPLPETSISDSVLNDDSTARPLPPQLTPIPHKTFCTALTRLHEALSEPDVIKDLDRSILDLPHVTEPFHMMSREITSCVQSVVDVGLINLSTAVFLETRVLSKIMEDQRWEEKFRKLFDTYGRFRGMARFGGVMIMGERDTDSLWDKCFLIEADRCILSLLDAMDQLVTCWNKVISTPTTDDREWILDDVRAAELDDCLMNTLVWERRTRIGTEMELGIASSGQNEHQGGVFVRPSDNTVWDRSFEEAVLRQDPDNDLAKSPRVLLAGPDRNRHRNDFLDLSHLLGRRRSFDLSGVAGGTAIHVAPSRGQGRHAEELRQLLNNFDDDSDEND